MSQYLLPTDETFVEHVARAIAFNRFKNDAESTLGHIASDVVKMVPEDMIEDMITNVFDTMWAGQSENDFTQRQIYRNEAIGVISSINLKLLTTIT